MRKPRFLLWTTFLLAFVSALIIMPKTHIRFGQSPLKVDTYIGGIDLDVFGGRLIRDAFKLNLDLQGGTSLTLQVDMKDIKPEDRESALLSSKEVIDKRINAFGVE